MCNERSFIIRNSKTILKKSFIGFLNVSKDAQKDVSGLLNILFGNITKWNTKLFVKPMME